MTVAVCAAVLPGATGCRYHKKSDTYYLIGNNLRLPYWKTIDSGFENAAGLYGVTAQLRGPDTFDPQGELAEFKKAVAAKPAGILVSVPDGVMFRGAINDAIGAGVPVITVDSDAPTTARLYFIGTDNLEAGHLGGARLLEKMGNKGNVIFFTNANQPNLDERLAGYKDVISAHAGIKVAGVIDIKGDAGAAFDQTEKLLGQTGPGKIDAFVCLEASAGKAVAEVLKRHNATGVTLVAMDVDPETLTLIRDGRIEATVSQKPYTMGYVGLKALDEVHHFHPQTFRTNYAVNTFSKYPQFVDTGTALVDKSNVEAYAENEVEANQQ